MTLPLNPPKQGLYDPWYEHDSCGVGFVADLGGRKSHDIVRKAIQVLENLEHRGACGCETNTGDGAGILIQMPHAFLREQCAKRKIQLPEPGRYGVGMLFMPTNPDDQHQVERILVEIIKEEGQQFLGWRSVPTDNAKLGASARALEPTIRQLFIQRNDAISDDLAFERKLYVIRKRFEAAVRTSTIGQRGMFYIPSLSHKTLVYKGMLNALQVLEYFPDLSDPLLESALAMVHSRFSTNTFPNWARAHPYRYLAHNGEINTLRGNIGWMHARETMFQSELFGDDIKKVLPIVDESGSDSAMFDNTLELLVLAGRSLPHAMMMMIPEPWGGDPLIPRLHDGAVGRPGLDRFHGWHAHRRRARSQRAAAVALLRHARWPGHHGVGSRRARRAGGKRQAERPAATRAHVAGRSRTGPDHRGREAQVRHCHRAALRRVAARLHDPARRDAARPRSLPHRFPHAHAAAASLRLHHRGLEAADRPDGGGRE